MEISNEAYNVLELENKTVLANHTYDNPSAQIEDPSVTAIGESILQAYDLTLSHRSFSPTMERHQVIIIDGVHFDQAIMYEYNQFSAQPILTTEQCGYVSPVTVVSVDTPMMLK